jgi:aspartyl-tRNA(Asn)/glutamyl-tRNA(Gln) amidotransferase subunit C
MEKMIGFVEKLNELDTSGIEPLMHMTQATNVRRPDVVSGTMTHEEALQNAPHHNQEFFLAPKVITRDV